MRGNRLAEIPAYPFDRPRLRAAALALLSALWLCAPGRAASLDGSSRPPRHESRDGGERCDPDAIRRWPRLLLIGEDHFDKGSISVKDAAIDLGVRGRLYVGLEGAFPGMRAEELSFGRAFARTPDWRLYGVDSYLDHGLIFSYFFALERPYPGVSRREMHDLFVTWLAKNPYMGRAWTELRSRGPLEPELEGMARAVDFAKSVKWSIPLNGDRDFQRIAELARRTHGLLVAGVNASYLARLGREKPLDPASAEDLEDLMHGLRDRALGEGILDAYCGAAAEGRAMAAVVGDGHVDGVRKLLLAWSGGRLPIETGRSFEAPAQVRSRLEELPDAPLAPDPAAMARDGAAYRSLASGAVSFQ